MTNDGHQSETAVKCLEVVHGYERHTISRDAANMAIIKILHDDPNVPRDDKTISGISDYAIGQYFVMLDQVDSTSEDRHTLSRSRQATLGSTLDNEGGASDREPEQRDEGGEDEQHDREHHGGRESPLQREASPEPSKVSRKRADENLYGWKSTAPSTVIDSNIADTLRLKSNYLCDLKGAKADVLRQIHCPRFPSSLWSDVLANKYIEFGKLLAHQNALKPSPRVLERIGDLEISTGAISEPVTAIVNMGQWTSAFAIYRKAVQFVFPHRGDELESYYDHIVQLFNSTIPQDHFRVINYDRSVRLLVGDSNALALNSQQEFNQLFISHMLPYGIGSRKFQKMLIEVTGQTQAR
ncbi:hypothetical protein BD410DRAFT_92208 [Rickenella mellea]|uniref:Uncharacterized protein n=1 Tax=Rickenella mellea TaxID=50990 RepID=A0A4Y7QB64_9AGAM|nr:hypothetical protein BD410DRAFT_92208 [Rickenella mellea]